MKRDEKVASVRPTTPAIEADGRRKVSKGYVNFATQLNDHMLVFAIQKYLLRAGEGFYLMDLGKCSMSNGKKCSSSPRWEVV